LSKEKEIITSQLRRPPQGLLGVAKHCFKGRPLVILTNPILEDKTPFPTVFWLTCPVLVKEVAKLESGGWIDRFQALLDKDEELYQKFVQAHESYRLFRKQLLSPASRMSLSSIKGKVLLETGVGGVRDFRKIKCLHAHYAHFLATGINPIGELIRKKIGEISSCQNECESE